VSASHTSQHTCVSITYEPAYLCQHHIWGSVPVSASHMSQHTCVAITYEPVYLCQHHIWASVPVSASYMCQRTCVSITYEPAYLCQHHIWASVPVSASYMCQRTCVSITYEPAYHGQHHIWASVPVSVSHIRQLPVSAYMFLSCSSHCLPSASVYGVYCVNSSTTWWPGGASVGSRLEGIVISIIGLPWNTHTYSYIGAQALRHFTSIAGQFDIYPLPPMHYSLSNVTCWNMCQPWRRGTPV